MSQTLLEPQADDAQHWHRCLQATGSANLLQVKKVANRQSSSSQSIAGGMTHRGHGCRSLAEVACSGVPGPALPALSPEKAQRCPHAAMKSSPLAVNQSHISPFTNKEAMWSKGFPPVSGHSLNACSTGGDDCVAPLHIFSRG